MNGIIDIRRLPGLTPCREAWALQEQLVRRACAGSEEFLLLLEHEPVYTIGSTPDHSSLASETALPYPVEVIRRGGQATYHGPGQLVGYPIVNLNHRRRDLHAYITALETALIAACAAWGVTARRRVGLTGVWVENRKIASIGVGVRQWVTMHGFALNVTPAALPPFGMITPCGLAGVEMTCLHHEGASSCTIDAFSHTVADCLIKTLETSLPRLAEEARAPETRTGKSTSTCPGNLTSPPS